MAKVSIVYHSGFGHTKLQAEAVYRGAASVKGIEARLLTSEEAIQQLDELDNADAIIFGCPTYMGNMSAKMKEFIEVAVKKWFTLGWKDKIAGAFTNSSSFSGDKLNTLFGLVINAMQHGMIYVGTGMMPSASHPGHMSRIQGPRPMPRTGSARLSGRCLQVFRCNLRMRRLRGTSQPQRRTESGLPRSHSNCTRASRLSDGVSRPSGRGRRRQHAAGPVRLG